MCFAQETWEQSTLDNTNVSTMSSSGRNVMTSRYSLCYTKACYEKIGFAQRLKKEASGVYSRR